ncbi:MAG: helix-turn-helix domain-containing protein [Fulvivirga sp.]
MENKLTDTANLAVNYINATNKSIFLTGKAGTGKTTLLKFIIENTHKNVAVAAPTGIAAINAGGVTLHSLLHLPFGSYLPQNDSLSGSSYDAQVNTPKSFLSQFKMANNKRNMLRSLDLLIIDEVSMLRADMLDCIDLVLRTIRRSQAPFGNLQILFIGDLNQLPPVIRNSEKALLQPYYNSGYFFEALALKNSDLIYIELDKIFRQSDPVFIGLLNKLRTNNLNGEEVAELNKHYTPDYEKENLEGYIHLTTHNRKAEEINQKALNKLDSKSYTFKAEVTGDFNENMYPLPEKSTFKVGAQVMFIKNDTSGEGLYFNGKIGEITNLSSNDIEVTIKDSGDAIMVQKHLWENKRYKLNAETNEIEEQVIGTFSQFPIKLAWAITVHKSQGLTFEKAILDLADSFAPGQMYVALSRLTGLKGLVLSSKLPTTGFENDIVLNDFEERKPELNQLQTRLEEDKKAYLFDLAIQSFSFQQLHDAYISHISGFYKEESRSAKQKHLEWTQAQFKQIVELSEVAKKFTSSLNKYARVDNGHELLTERIEKANEYFQPALKELIKSHNQHIAKIATQKRIKGYLKELDELGSALTAKVNILQKTGLFFKATKENRILSKDDLREQLISVSKLKSPVEKIKKVPTAEISFKLYQDGRSVEEIAKEREFVTGTIIGHLCKYIETGEVKAQDLISKEKLETVLKVIGNTEEVSQSEIKSKLGDEYEYQDIKVGLAYRDYLAAKGK